MNKSGNFQSFVWDRKSKKVLIKSVTPGHDAQVLSSFRVSNPLCLTALTAKSEAYTTVAPQHLPSTAGKVGSSLVALFGECQLTYSQTANYVMHNGKDLPRAIQ